MNKHLGLNHTLLELTHGTYQNSTNQMNINGKLKLNLGLLLIVQLEIMMNSKPMILDQPQPTGKEIDILGMELIQVLLISRLTNNPTTMII